MSESIIDDPERELAKVVKAWLLEKQAPLLPLLNWLQGFDLPSESYGLRPYQWLMRVLPHDGSRPKFKARLASRLAELLNCQPEIKPVGELPLELVENLFLLCGSLERPDELAGPLYAVYLRNCSGPSELLADTAARSALRSALTYNQIDDRLRPVWERLLQRQPDPCIIGNPNAGFDGMLYKPASITTRGQPDLDALGTAFFYLAQYLESDRNERNRRFDQLIELVRIAYPRPEAYWNPSLLQQALTKHWPQWALLRLPSLCVIEASGHGFLWHPIFDIIAQDSKWEKQVIKEHAGGEIIEAKLSPEAVDFAQWAAIVFDTLRIGNPWASVRSAHATAVDSCHNLVDLVQVYEASMGSGDFGKTKHLSKTQARDRRSSSGKSLKVSGRIAKSSKSTKTAGKAFTHIKTARKFQRNAIPKRASSQNHFLDARPSEFRRATSRMLKAVGARASSRVLVKV